MVVVIAKTGSIGGPLIISCSKLAKLSSKGSAYCIPPDAKGDNTLVAFGLSGEGITPWPVTPVLTTPKEGCAATGEGIVGGLSLIDCFRTAGAATGVATAGGLMGGDGPLDAIEAEECWGGAGFDGAETEAVVIGGTIGAILVGFCECSWITAGGCTQN